MLATKPFLPVYIIIIASCKITFTDCKKEQIMRAGFMMNPDIYLYRVIKGIRNTFDSFGYIEIFPEAVEKYSRSFSDGVPFVYANKFYLINPDITSRLILRNFSENTRIFYIYEKLSRSLESEIEAGLELINVNEEKSNIEILRVLIKTLENLGIYDFKIDISVSNIFSGKIGKRNYEKIREYIKMNDFNAIKNSGIKKEYIDYVIKMLNSRGTDINVELLNNIKSAVNDDRIIIDPGTVRYFSYYSGLIFEIYSDDYFIGGGGNYKIKNSNGCGFSLNTLVLSKILRRL